MIPVFFCKTNLFVPMLLASMTAHIFLIGISGLMPTPVQFAVQQAPRSMDVTLVEQKVIPPVPEIPETPIVQMDAEHPVTAAVIERHPVADIPKQQAQPFVFDEGSRGAVTQARPLDHINQSPLYPRTARRKGWEGTVFLKVLVNPNGMPEKIVVAKSSGYPMLDDSAMETVRKWKFSPAQTGLLKFASWITIPVQFTLIEEYSN